MIDASGRLSRIEHEVIRHVPGYTGEIWYISKGGNDGYSGHSPHQAFLTIGAAVTAASAGDAITVKAGTYDEDGLDVSLDGLELWGELGVVLTNAGNGGGTVLTVSGDYCRIENIRVTQAAQIGVVVTGARCIFHDVHVGPGNSVAWNITGNSVTLERCHAGLATTTGFALAANGAKFVDCWSTSDGSATRGFYVTAGLRGRFYGCSSVGHATAGFHVMDGANYHNFLGCSSGGGDGDRIDAGYRNFWPGFVDRRRREAHEHIYPVSAGQGGAGDPVTVSNTTTDGDAGTREDQNYWGDVAVIVPPDTFATAWYCLGLYIHTETAADIQQWQAFFTDAGCVADQDGGNDWDENETALTVSDGTLFQANDFVWIMGNDLPAGEIMKVHSVADSVVTLVRETTADAEDGLRYDYVGDPGANKMYLVYRASDREFHGYDGDHESGSTRDSVRYEFTEQKLIFANGGMIIRLLNATDGNVSSFDVRVFYMD